MVKKLVTSDLFPLIIAAAAGPLFVFPRERWLWICLLVPLVSIVRALFGLPALRRTPCDLALAVLVVWVLLGTLLLPDIGPSVEKLAGFVFGVIVFYAVLEAARRPGRLKAGIALFLAVGAVVAVVGTLGRHDSKSLENSISGRILSEVPKLDLKIERTANGVNPNPLGGTLLLFIPAGLALAPFVLKKESGLIEEKFRPAAFAFIVGVIAVATAAVVFSRSSGAWGALLFSLLILGRQRRFIKAAVGICLIAAAAFLWLKVDRPIAETDESLRGTLVHSIHNRFPAWAEGLAAVREKPLFGVGLDRFRLRAGVDYDLAHAHNQFLHTAAETGIPGLAAYLAVLLAAGWMAVQTGFSGKPAWMRAASAGLAVGQAGFAVFGLTDAVALGAKPGLFFWISLGLITAIYLAPDETAAEETPACS